MKNQSLLDVRLLSMTMRTQMVSDILEMGPRYDDTKGWGLGWHICGDILGIGLRLFVV